MPTNRRAAVYLNGHSCLRCGKGWYDGYPGPNPKTVNPCQNCGHIMPASMAMGTMMGLIKCRDASGGWNDPILLESLGALIEMVSIIENGDLTENWDAAKARARNAIADSSAYHLHLPKPKN